MPDEERPDDSPSGLETDSELNSDPTARGLRTVKVVVVFVGLGMLTGLLLGLFDSAGGQYYLNWNSEWPVWLVVTQILAMPLIVRICGWPAE